MLAITTFKVNTDLIDRALQQIPGDEFKFILNKPTGNFFYDPWQLKDEFKGTVWEQIYDSLPVKKGEARIIRLLNAQCYSSHADIDDRYHLNLSGENSYLIDLANQQMHKLSKDGIWYDMNAGMRHTAANFGNRPRYQLVVRQLLNRSYKEDLIKVRITSNITDLEDARYEFDNVFSPFLNAANRNLDIDNFEHTQSYVQFSVVDSLLERIRELAQNKFNVEII